MCHNHRLTEYEISLETLAKHLLALCDQAAATLPLPRVHHIYIPPTNPNFVKSRKFGLVVLADHSTGFFYNLLEVDRSGPIDNWPSDVLELASWFDHDDIARRGIGLGAISAITQHFFRATRFCPDQATNPMAGFAFSRSDHVGMIGYFPALVKKLRQMNIPLTVLELDEQFLHNVSVLKQIWYEGGDSNPYRYYLPDPKSGASTNSATLATCYLIEFKRQKYAD